MATNQDKSTTTGDSSAPGFLSGAPKQQEERSITPWVIAGAVVVLVVLVLVFLSGHRNKGLLADTSTTPDAYASQLTLGDIMLSQSSNIAGSQITYVDGAITNHGDRTVDGLSVQATFHLSGSSSQVVPTLLNLIRARQPYIDIEPVSADPLKPGESKPFRLIFDHVDPQWDQKDPDLAILHVHFR
jgi:hypothetical protein